ncbi:MAG: hypothetical protein KIT56_02740 [Gammaproteobacteria bacterium]|nr:hypothetical protein [Gammaproteobacteria bacterium]MCW5582794.1 hypothetical protein [Gammaproteobacteria bacterium]
MKIALLLKEMRKRISSNHSNEFITSEVIKNIRKIKEICNSDYYDQSFYGAAALNRKILLDERIANLLTSETILAILAIHSTTYKFDSNSSIAVWRNSSGYTSLAAILFFGFNEGLETIRLMPNNEPHYGSKLYREQQQKYKDHTNKIISNVIKAAEKLGINVDNKKYQDNEISKEKSLVQIYDEITNIIEKIKKDRKSNQLLYVPDYSPDNIRDQSISGFIAICQALNINFKKSLNGSIIINKPVTLQNFIEKFLSSEETLLNGTIMHLFYDRVHLEACIEQDTNIIIENKEYALKDILREIIRNCEESNVFVCNTAKEQFKVRLKLVETHLKENFPSGYQDRIKEAGNQVSPISIDHVPIGYSGIKKLISLLDHEIEKEMWSCKNAQDKHLEKNFLQEIIDFYDQANGKISLKKCMVLAKRQNPQGYQQAMSKQGMKLTFNILLDKMPDNLLQGPRLKTQATMELEKIIHALLSNYKSISHSFNSLDELEIVIDGVFFNITQILSHDPDFEHIALTQEQLETYAHFVTKNARNKPILRLPNNELKIPSPEDYKKIDTNNECSHLHYGEKLAITLYTSGFYIRIQSFLRSLGQSERIRNLSETNLKQLVPEILLNSCIAAHGLSKTPGTAHINENLSYRISFRKEQASSNTHYFQKRLKAIENRNPLYEQGFISTSENNSYNAKGHNVFIAFNEYKNLSYFGKNIRVISRHPYETEVLYAPGIQIQYTNYIKIKEQHFFSVRPVRSIEGIKPDHYSPLLKAWHELEIIDKALDNHIHVNKHGLIHKIFDTVSNDEKIACVQSVRKAIRSTLDTIKSHDKLDKKSLETCKESLEIAINKNSELVRNSTLYSSLGKTDVILQSALQRVSYAIQLIDNYLITHRYDNEKIQREYSQQLISDTQHAFNWQ